MAIPKAHGPRRSTAISVALVAFAAAASSLAPTPARASVVLTATLPQPPPPLANAISRSEPSALTVRVANTGTQIVREVTITLPSGAGVADYGNVTGASAPDPTWAVALNGGTARFSAVNCSSAGIPPNDSALFVIQFNGPTSSNNGDNAASSPFPVWGTTSSGSNVCDPSVATSSTSFTSPVKALYITGTVARTAANEATVNPIPRALTPGYLEYENALDSAFQDIRQGADVKTSLDKAVQQINTQMKKYQK